MTTLPDGILLVDKPLGITSFDVIRRIRKDPVIVGLETGRKLKLGHAGTLDPLASGLMILAEGKATKLLHNYLKLPKKYEAEVCIGESTATGDREGQVLQTTEVSNLTSNLVQEALMGMVGMLDLPVPIYSAIKQGGEALYKKARRGEKVEVPIKQMEVTEAVLTDLQERGEFTYASVNFSVGSGTYVRSLAEELGRRLGYPARLENLRRSQVGEFHVKDAVILT